MSLRIRFHGIRGSSRGVMEGELLEDSVEVTAKKYLTTIPSNLHSTTLQKSTPRRREHQKAKIRTCNSFHIILPRNDGIPHFTLRLSSSSACREVLSASPSKIYTPLLLPLLTNFSNPSRCGASTLMNSSLRSPTQHLLSLTRNFPTQSFIMSV